MGKSDVRLLPPLVNGRLSGVLEFGVDYVEITEKIFKDEHSNFLIQIIWWGETKPLLLRSKQIKFFTKDNKQVTVDEQDGYGVRYEVRTKTKLFKSYLTKCEEVEVAVIDSVNNEIIGSTFLKNLIHLVYNDDYITNSLISDSGDEIGKITCHFKFSEVDLGVQNHKLWKTGIDLVPFEKWNNNGLKISLNLTELYSPMDDLLNLYESSRTDKENKSAKCVNVHYNSPVTRISDLTCANSQTECLPVWKEKTQVINAESEHLEKSPKKSDVCVENEIKCADSGNLAENVTLETAERDDATEKTLPSAKAKMPTRKEAENPSRSRNGNLKHSAKVTNKKTTANNVKESTGRKLPKNKPNPTERTARGLMTDKGKPSEVANAKNSAIVPKCNKTLIKPSLKPIGSIKTFAKVSTEISKLHKLYLNGDEHRKHIDLENVPVKETAREAVEKVQSSSSITLEMAQDPERDETDRKNVRNSTKIKVNNKLFFDLNDPIEKLYYETFFQKTETLGNNEFEIAELLNQPGNNYVSEGNPRDESPGKHLHENKLQTESDIDVNRTNLSPVDVRRTDSSSNDEEADPDVSDGKKSMSEYENCLHDYPKSEEYKTDCYRCKYYKKLSELDKIIDALKTFEAKLRTEVCDKPIAFHDCGETLPAEIQQKSEKTVTGDMGVNSNESDYSKEDSDFIEFRRYLSKR